MMDFFMVEVPMWCSRGHQVSMPAVKIWKACAGLALTVMLFWMGSIGYCSSTFLLNAWRAWFQNCSKYSRSESKP